MIKNTKEFQNQLLAWFDDARRDLPWRRTTNPYAIWVSEVMLQQTQAATVVDYYTRFLRIFPTLAALAEADLQQILKAWEGLGYYARARNLHKAARDIVEHHGGVLPETGAALVEVRGIGPYTAAAIASIAFGERAAVLDGNVIRVLARVGLVRENPKQKAALTALRNLAEHVLSPDRPGDFNQAMMELGATLCTPRKPKCLLCPVSRFCGAHQQLSDPSVLPMKVRKPEVPHHEMVAGLIWDDGYVFIDRRQENGLLGGLWEFPGGRVQGGETPQEALRRQVREQVNLDVGIGDYLMDVRHAFSHFKMTLRVYHCILKGGEPVINASTDWKWVKPQELAYYPFAAANKKIITRLIAELALPHGRS